MKIGDAVQLNALNTTHDSVDLSCWDKGAELRLKGFVKRCNAACAGGPGVDCVIFEDMAEGCGTACCG